MKLNIGCFVCFYFKNNCIFFLKECFVVKIVVEVDSKGSENLLFNSYWNKRKFVKCDDINLFWVMN